MEQPTPSQQSQQKQLQEQHKGPPHVDFPPLGYPGPPNIQYIKTGYGDEPKVNPPESGFRKRSMGNLVARDWDDLEKRYWNDLELDARDYNDLDDLG